jgi:hypothetical protein
MAVAKVRSAAATPVTSGVATAITLSAFDSSGGNCLLWCVGWRDGGGETNNTATFDGNAMTAVASGENISSGARAKVWKIDSPSGTGNAVGNFSGGPPQRIHAHAILFSGADVAGTSVGTAQNENEGAGATAGLTVTTIAGGMVADFLYAREDTDFTPNGSQVAAERSTVAATDAMESSTLAASGTSTGVGWAETIGAGFAYIAVPINPAAAAGRTSKNIRSNPLGVNLGMGLGIGGAA